MSDLKVLVVDDEARMRKIVKDFLVAKDYKVVEASNGEEAIDIVYEDKDIDLVLLDVMMPRINGYKISRLLKFDKKYKDIPILMITARSQEEDKLIGEETGADEYITKPFDLDNVIKTVQKYLGKDE